MGDSMTLTQADFDTLQNERDLERDAYEARIAELEVELKDEQNNSDYLGNQYAKALRQLDTMKTERDSWMKRCERLVETMRIHGFKAETLARIAEGVD